MRRHDKRSLILGMVIGIAVAGVAAVGISYRLGQTAAPAATTSTPGSSIPGEPNETQIAAQLSPDEQAKIGIQISEVRRETLAQEIAAIGRVEEPESAIATVSTRFGGRVERLFVKYAGQPVEQGDPIATITITGQPAGKDDPVASIYSRDLIAAAEEYKFALQNREQAHASSRPDAIAQADALVEASRVRLQRWGLSPQQVDGLISSPEQPIRVTVNATNSGIVRSRKVAEGQFVNPGETLVELTDLKTIWVKVDVFDTDLAKIGPGLTGTITSEALPGTKLSGKVDFIDPRSDPQTRTTPVRIQVENPGTRLKPGMIVQAAFRLSTGSVLTIPRDAVLDSGTEKVVYIARDNGVFQQQRIQTGAPVNDRYPVLEGLKQGDRVVTSGVFLVDSQTRLTGGITGMFGGSKSYAEGTAAPAATPAAYKMTVRLEPDPPQGAKENKVHVTLVDAAGKAVADAQVRASFQMPAMPAMNMPEMRNGTDLKWTGTEYVGPIQIMMSGGWNVTVEARRGPELLSTAQSHINAR